MEVQLLSITMIGAFKVQVSGRDVKLATRKSAAILACVALSDDREISRERLAGLLWSETESEKARASLRQALHELKDALSSQGYDGLETDKLRVRLADTTISIDVTQIMAFAKAGEAHTLILGKVNALDDLLASLESVDPAFQAWVTGRRRHFEDGLTHSYEAALAHGNADPRQVEQVARALCAVDPTNEVGTRSLMTARLAQGDTAGALAAYKALYDLLDDEYETKPSRQTQEFFAHIKMSDELGQTAGSLEPLELSGFKGAAVEGRRPNSLVSDRQNAATGTDRRIRLVLSIAPFDVSGVPESQHYLVHGFRRDLVSSLVRFREWAVRDGGASPAISYPHDAYTFEASAFVETKGIRLALMLRDNASGLYLWSDRIKIATDQWFEAQQTIVRRLAAVLNVQVSSGRLAEIMNTGNADMTVYDEWLRGQSDIFSWNPARWRAGLDAMRALTRRAPAFSPGFSMVAQMLNTIQFVQIGHVRTRDNMAESIGNGLEAVRLDPVDSRAHLALGWSYAMAGQHDRGAVHHDLAMDLNDNDSWTLLSSAWGAACGMRHDLALQRAELGMALSVAPTPVHQLYWAHIAFARGDYQACVDVDPGVWQSLGTARGWHVAALGKLGRHDEARSSFGVFAENVRAAWIAAPPPSDAAVGCWFLKLFPFSSQTTWNALRDGLAAADVDVSAARFGVLED